MENNGNNSNSKIAWESDFSGKLTLVEADTFYELYHKLINAKIIDTSEYLPYEKAVGDKAGWTYKECLKMYENKEYRIIAEYALSDREMCLLILEETRNCEPRLYCYDTNAQDYRSLSLSTDFNKRGSFDPKCVSVYLRDIIVLKVEGKKEKEDTEETEYKVTCIIKGFEESIKYTKTSEGNKVSLHGKSLWDSMASTDFEKLEGWLAREAFAYDMANLAS